MPKTISSPAAGGRSQFAEMKGVDLLNRHLKPGDSAALAQLLFQTCFYRTMKGKVFKALDVGGSNGLMMIALLQALSMQACICVNEPHKNPDRLAEYQQLERTQPQHVGGFFAPPIVAPIESYEGELPQVDLVLASHVLYYNQFAWSDCSSLSDHMFTKLLRSLSPSGVMCIVIQSSRVSETGTHELMEDFVYPFVESIQHGTNKYYANAEMVDVALSKYRQRFMYEHQVPIGWCVKEDYVVTKVPLGDINTDTTKTIEIDQEASIEKREVYSQPDDVLAILQFYLKERHFYHLDLADQKRFLEFIVSNFKNETGNFEVCHLNKVYTIEMTPELHKLLHAHEDLARIGFSAGAE